MSHIVRDKKSLLILTIVGSKDRKEEDLRVKELTATMETFGGIKEEVTTIEKL